MTFDNFKKENWTKTDVLLVHCSTTRKVGYYQWSQKAIVRPQREFCLQVCVRTPNFRIKYGGVLNKARVETAIAGIVLETIARPWWNVECAPRGVPNMKFPRRNGGGNFYKWLPWGAAGGLFSERLSLRTHIDRIHSAAPTLLIGLQWHTLAPNPLAKAEPLP